MHGHARLFRFRSKDEDKVDKSFAEKDFCAAQDRSKDRKGKGVDWLAAVKVREKGPQIRFGKVGRLMRTTNSIILRYSEASSGTSFCHLASATNDPVVTPTLRSRYQRSGDISCRVGHDRGAFKETVALFSEWHGR